MASRVAKNRVVAINTGNKLYFREKPCVTCGEKVFRVNKIDDVCNSCMQVAKKKNVKQNASSVNYLSNIS